MSDFEKISLGVAAFSALLSLIAIIMSVIANRKTNSFTAQANQISADALELQRVSIRLQEASVEQEIRDSIRLAEAAIEQVGRDFEDVFTKTGRLTKAEQARKDLATAALKSALEAQHNAYDDACSKYLDKKVPGDRFKATYQTSIRRLVEKDALKEFIKLDCSYHSIMKVYKLWETPEINNPSNA